MPGCAEQQRVEPVLDIGNFSIILNFYANLNINVAERAKNSR